MAAPPFTINSLRWDLSIRRSWICELLSLTGERAVCRGTFAQAVEHEHLGRIERGTVSIEHFPLGEWYNYFIFYEVDGRLRNYYFNIAMPPVVKADSIDFVDLDIDLIVWPSGKYEVVDLDEFGENSLRYAYPPDVRTRALETLERLEGEIRRGELPPGLDVFSQPTQ